MLKTDYRPPHWTAGPLLAMASPQSVRQPRACNRDRAEGWSGVAAGQETARANNDRRPGQIGGGNALPRPLGPLSVTVSWDPYHNGGTCSNGDSPNLPYNQGKRVMYKEGVMRGKGRAGKRGKSGGERKGEAGNGRGKRKETKEEKKRKRKKKEKKEGDIPAWGWSRGRDQA